LTGGAPSALSSAFPQPVFLWPTGSGGHLIRIGSPPEGGVIMAMWLTWLYDHGDIDR
jgi:hypothetical protein